MSFPSIRLVGMRLMVLMLGLLLVTVYLAGPPTAAAVEEEKKAINVTCSYCQERGFPYLCHATMASGICFVNSGDVSCNGAEGCTCCRTADAAGCTFCSVEADWDAYDDDEEDI